MKGSIFLAVAILVFVARLRAADATTPIDFTQRNGSFAPGPTISLPKKTLPMAGGIQDKRVAPPTVEKAMAGVGDRRAAIDVAEAHPKTVLPAAVERPEARPQELSGMNHRLAAITTATEKEKPPMVAKYQDSLTAVNAVKSQRFPALGQNTAAKINRFVFRKNSSETVVAPGGVPIVPAAGGSRIVQ